MEYDDLLGSGLHKPEWRHVEVDAAMLPSGFMHTGHSLGATGAGLR